MKKYVYEITELEPDEIVVESVNVNIEDQKYNAIIRFRFGITDLGGGQWGSYTLLHHYNPKIGASYVAAVKATYAKFNAIFLANKSALDQARGWENLVIGL